MPREPMGDEDSERESNSAATQSGARPVLEISDESGRDGEAFDADADAGDIPPCEVSNFPLADICKTIALRLQQDELAAIPSKSRKSRVILDLLDIEDTDSSFLKEDCGTDLAAVPVDVRGLSKRHADMVALPKMTIAVAKKQ